MVKTRPEERALLPALTHVDGTGRLHTVKRSRNRRYYDLIQTFTREKDPSVVGQSSCRLWHSRPRLCAKCDTAGGG